jgi:hypothetical protein
MKDEICKTVAVDVRAVEHSLAAADIRARQDSEASE